MLQRIRNYLIVIIVVGIFYFLLSNHIMFSFPSSFHVLHKSELTLIDTFVSLESNRPEDLLRNDALRASGIEALLVEKGLLTQEKANSILRGIDRE